MPKARAHPDQIGFSFEEARLPMAAAGLAGLEARIARKVGELIASDGRPREIIAAEMSVMLDDEVSRAMLDAYSSPARHDHKVPMSRFLGLVGVTGRVDLLDPLVREVGGTILIGEEVATARIGHLRLQKQKIEEELRALERGSAPIIREGRLK